MWTDPVDGRPMWIDPQTGKVSFQPPGGGASVAPKPPAPPQPTPTPTPTPQPTPAPKILPAPEGTTPLEESHPLAQMLRRIGVQGPLGPAPSINPMTGAMLSGPNPVITAPFRHLFNQQQITNYGQRVPAQFHTVDPNGTYKTQSLNWWDPNAELQKAIAGLTGGGGGGRDNGGGGGGGRENTD